MLNLSIRHAKDQHTEDLIQESTKISIRDLIHESTASNKIQGLFISNHIFESGMKFNLVQFVVDAMYNIVADQWILITN